MPSIGEERKTLIRAASQGKIW